LCKNHLSHVIKLQMTEIAKLRTENKQLLDWITGESDALTLLAGYLSESSIQRIQQDQSSDCLAVRTAQVVGGGFSPRL
jgi:hypothetical protein